MYYAEKRKVARSGKASLGWIMGQGYTTVPITVNTEVWCVMKDKKVIAECRSKDKADKIVYSLNNVRFY